LNDNLVKLREIILDSGTLEERVFHHRTWSAGTMMGCGQIFFLLFFYLTVRMVIIQETGNLFICQLSAAWFGFFGYLIFAEYWNAKILVNMEGVTFLNGLGQKQRLSWNQVENIKVEGYVITITLKDGSKNQRSTLGYICGKEIPALMTERLTEYRRAMEQ
jgi:hypothetical protein